MDGVSENLAIKDFGYFDMDFNEQFMKSFKYMQEKYIFKEEYKITIDEVRNALDTINKLLKNSYIK